MEPQLSQVERNNLSYNSSILPQLGPPEDRQLAAEIEALVRAASKPIAITGHERPDGDCIGSEVALASILREAGFNATIVNSDPVPAKYKFLAEEMDVRVAGTDEQFEADLLFVLDSTDLSRIGKLTPQRFGSPKIVNIDHHLRNPDFGVANWVDTKAAATGELIWRLASCCGWKAPFRALQALYTALITDTGQFAYSNSTPRVLRMAAEMVERGVEPESIWRQVYLNKSAAEMALEARARASMQCTVNGRVCSIALAYTDFKETGTGPQDTEDFVAIPRSLAGVEIAIFFYEIDEGRRTKASFRSTRSIDVSALARKFGGGGHRQAAGCTIDAGLHEARLRLLKEVQEFLNGTA